VSPSGARVDSGRRVRLVGQTALVRTASATATRRTASRAWTCISFGVRFS